MLRKIFAWTLIFLISTFAVVALTFDGIDHYQECQEAYAREQTANHRSNATEVSHHCFSQAFGKSAEAIAILLTALATIGLVYYTLKLGEDGEAQREHAHMVERGYIQMRADPPGLRQAKLAIRRDPANQDHMISLRVNNFGAAPALATQILFGTKVTDSEAPLTEDEITFDKKRYGNTAFLVSGESFYFLERIPTATFNPLNEKIFFGLTEELNTKLLAENMFLDGLEDIRG